MAEDAPPAERLCHAMSFLDKASSKLCKNDNLEQLSKLRTKKAELNFHNQSCSKRLLLLIEFLKEFSRRYILDKDVNPGMAECFVDNTQRESYFLSQITEKNKYDTAINQF